MLTLPPVALIAILLIPTNDASTLASVNRTYYDTSSISLNLNQSL